MGLVGVALAAVGDAPLIDFTIAGLIEQLFGTTYARRQQAWLHYMHALLIDLQARGIDLNEIADRPEFVTAVHDATRIALGEHLEAKLVMLQAVFTSAATHPPDPITDL